MGNKPERPYCRWLHLSDIHIVSKAEDDWGRDTILYGSKGELDAGNAGGIDEGGLNWYIRNNPVDCIVITGDFFFRGGFDTESENALRSFLKAIYKICSNASEWGWEDTSPMERLFWCPGNHDLNREAVELNDGVPVFRDKIISSANDKGHFCPKKENRQLLTEQSFQTVFRLICELRGEKPNSEMYEAQLFRVPKLTDPPVSFLAVNTALSAGQLCEEPLDNEIERAYTEFSIFHNTQRSKQALTAYKKYHECLQAKKRQVVVDEGKLIFISEESKDQIHNQLMKIGRCITILIGHHPYDHFDQEAKKRFASFVQQNGIRLYLHGHTHIIQSEASTSRRSVFSRSENPAQSIGVGGLYLNTQDEYNQLSFSIGSIKILENNRYSYSISLLTFTPSSYNDRQWMQIISPIHGVCSIASPCVPHNNSGSVHTNHQDKEGSISTVQYKDSVNESDKMNIPIQTHDIQEDEKKQPKKQQKLKNNGSYSSQEFLDDVTQASRENKSNY